jgi:hypothetical protein
MAGPEMSPVRPLPAPTSPPPPQEATPAPEPKATRGIMGTGPSVVAADPVPINTGKPRPTPNTNDLVASSALIEPHAVRVKAEESLNIAKGDLANAQHDLERARADLLRITSEAEARLRDDAPPEPYRIKDSLLFAEIFVSRTTAKLTRAEEAVIAADLS